MGDFNHIIKKRLVVSLYKSNLTDGDGNSLGTYGKIKRKTISIEQIIESIQKKNPGISEQLMITVARYIADEIPDYIAQGYAVDMLGMGALGLRVEGHVDAGMTPQEVASHFKLSFVPSKRAENAVKNLSVSHVSLESSPMQISEVKMSFASALNEAEENVIYQNRPVMVTGSHLKIGGDVCGLFLAPVIEDGIFAPREEWISLPMPYINTPKRLEFFLPDSFALEEEGEKFCLAAITSLNKNSTSRKSSMEAFSSPFVVRK